MSLLSKAIFKLGIFFRNPSLPKYYSFLKKSENWSLKELEVYQLNKLKEFLTFVNNYSPYYKEVFREIHFDPKKIECLDDLDKIPIISKSTLIENSEEIYTNYKFNKLFYSETSGTSGQAIRFYKNEEWDSHNRATMYRAYSWYGVKPWDRNGYFWGYNIDKKIIFRTKILDFLQNRLRIFSYSEDEIINFVKKIKRVKYLNGYSSMIFEISKKVNDLGLNSKFNLKMIKGTSEKIYSSYQQEIIRAFGTKMISEYGAAETGLIAFECKAGNMHINIENVIVEEEEGEIVVTNLLSKSFPIVRYKLGDSITFKDDNFKCSCGREHPIIEDVLGRVGKNVIGYKNQYPSLTFYNVFKNLAFNNIVLNYQAVQNKKGIVNIRIEQNAIEFQDEIEKELNKYFNDDIIFNIEYNQKLHSMDGKLKDFIQDESLNPFPSR